MLGSLECVLRTIEVRCPQDRGRSVAERRSQCPMVRVFHLQITRSMPEGIEPIAPPSRVDRSEKVDPTPPRGGLRAPMDSVPRPWLSHLLTGETRPRDRRTAPS